MNTTLQRRPVLLAGLLLVLMVALAAGAQVAQAITASGTGSGSSVASSGTTASLDGLTTNALKAHHQGATASQPLLASAAGTQGRGGVGAAPFAPATGAQPASSSQTGWIVAGSALAALLIIAAWMLTRRRRRSDGLASAASRASADEAFCARHPEDALCRVA
jgi:hypothetical protein